MTPHEIRTELFRRKLTQTAIAEEAGVSRFTVSQVVAGRMRTPVVRRIIAKHIGFSYRTVWGTDDPGVDHYKPGRRPASS